MLTASCTICIILLPLIILIFCVLAWKSNLLRDEIDDKDVFMAEAAKTRYKGLPFEKIPKPFSLARTQLAIWTTIIACVYVYLYFWVGCDAMTLNKTALILMGISVTTTAAGNVIDKNQAQANATTNAQAAANGNNPPPANALGDNAAIPPAPANNPPGNAITPENKVSRSQNAPSQGFLMDLVSDKNGVNIHRFQNVMWTIIAMVVYVYAAAHTLYSGTCGLPTLDDTLLAITAISNGTYVGLKVNENKENA